MSTNEEIDIYESMSDEDFAKLSAPVSQGTSEPAAQEPAEADDGAAQEAQVQAAASADPEDAADASDEEDAGAAEIGDVADADLGVKPVTPNHTTPNQVEANPTEAAAEGTGSDAEANAAPAVAETAVDYEAEYKRIMAPFKANNRDFAPSSPDEAIRLMQMGANYTKKMQAIAPNMKLMRMLDNNGLLDEGKINFLIDLNRKDPGAIQKLLHESKIDPLDLSTTEEPKYQPGNHSVSDQEMQFHEVLGDTLSSPGGRETVQMINTQWDRASKEAIYKEPAVLAIINEQRNNGIFDRISAEIDRQKILGNLANVPFLQAYKSVGDTLHSQGLLVVAPKPAAAQQAAVVQPQQQQPRVLETRVAAPKAPLTNAAAARAAMPSKSAPVTAKPEFDPFSMTDAEIMAISSPPRG